jgi:hypothetical protein
MNEKYAREEQIYPDWIFNEELSSIENFENLYKNKIEKLSEYLNNTMTKKELEKHFDNIMNILNVGDIAYIKLMELKNKF